MTWQRLGCLGLVSAVVSAALAGGPSLAQQVIKIGAPLALTGGLADSGKKQKLGFDLWLARVKQAGGITVGGQKHQVELVTYDYQTDGKRAGELAEKLINDDKVSFMIAPFGSGHTKITAAVAERYGVPIVAVASSEPVHDQGFKNLFGTLAPSSGLIEAMLTKFKAAKPDLQSIAILGREDVFPKLMADLMKKGAEKAGLKVVYSATYPIGSVDHSAALTAMRIASALVEINQAGTTILLVEQDVLTAIELARRGFVIELGRTTMSGETSVLAEDSNVRQAYMGF